MSTSLVPLIVTKYALVALLLVLWVWNHRPSLSLYFVYVFLLSFIFISLLSYVSAFFILASPIFVCQFLSFLCVLLLSLYVCISHFGVFASFVFMFLHLSLLRTTSFYSGSFFFLLMLQCAFMYSSMLTAIHVFLFFLSLLYWHFHFWLSLHI